ncbi:hypothetical protein BV898_17025 [Hypsibius exemplaris]|uniref:SRCR domain-containing protein n=1 Tax=Hypsibius exemplaris TaxID=2072580 RepID=A0A9X6NFZ0_HYPEX|nr:hypothetical protein BV898_17025 [Hypsibius exemplaris]
MKFPLSVYLWIVCLTFLFHKSDGEEALVRLLQAQDTSVPDSVRGMLEVRRTHTDPWRKVCGRLKATSPVIVAACKDLGYKRVHRVEVGGLPRLLGDLWAVYNVTICPVNPPPGFPEISSLAECGDPSPSSGVNDACNRQQRWIYLTCVEKAPPKTDDSIILCGGSGSDPNRKLPTGTDLTIMIKDGKNCDVRLSAKDSEAIVVTRTTNWITGLSCSGSASNGRLKFRTINALNGTVNRDEAFCSERTVKAARDTNLNPIEIGYAVPTSAVTVPEVFNISVTVRRPLTCSVNRMDIRVLKPDIGFQASGDIPEVTLVSKVSARVASCADEVPADVDSDVVQIQLSKCGLTAPVPEIGAEVQEEFESIVTYSHVIPQTNPDSAIEYVQKLKYSYRCRNTGWNFSSQIFTLT